MTLTTINVRNIAPNTTQSQLSHFFSFCGTIASISMSPSSGAENAPLSASITFERESAAKTAVLLDGTPLNDSTLVVEPTPNIQDIAGANNAQHAEIGPDGEITQESKPRSAIFAEYLASGYALGDAVLERGIELDKKHGLTAKFANYLTSALNTLDTKTHATDRAKSMDNQYHLREKAWEAKNSLARYFEKALDTGPGNKLRSFYASSEKQALDIHNEAKRLAELKIQKRRKSQEVGASANEQPFVGPDTTTCACGSSESKCTCPPDKCACPGCGKSSLSPKKEAESKASAAGQFDHAVKDIKQTAQDIMPEKS